MKWDTCPDGFALRHILKASNRAITRLAWSPDGRYADSGAYDQMVKVWDLTGDTEVGTLRGHTGRIGSMTVTPGNRYAISGAGDKKIKIQDKCSAKDFGFRQRSPGEAPIVNRKS